MDWGSNGLGEYGCSADCENCTRTLADPGFLTTTPSLHYSNSNTPSPNCFVTPFPSPSAVERIFPPSA
jgi:hypothetical protein